MSNDECRKSKARGIANRPAAKEEVAVRGRTTADEQLWICRDGAGVYLGEVEAPDLHHARSVAMGRWPGRGAAAGWHIVNRAARERLRRKLEAEFERDRHHTACHEAGHAVLARRLGVEVERVEIGLRMEESGGRHDPGADSFGRFVFGPTPTDRGPLDSFLEANILVILGGCLAENRSKGCLDWRNLGGRSLDGSDRAAVDSMAWRVVFHRFERPDPTGEGRVFDPGRHDRRVRVYLKQLRAWSADEVEVAWPGIAAVAAELELREVLSGADVDRALAVVLPRPGAPAPDGPHRRCRVRS